MACCRLRVQFSTKQSRCSLLPVTWLYWRKSLKGEISEETSSSANLQILHQSSRIPSTHRRVELDSFNVFLTFTMHASPPPRVHSFMTFDCSRAISTICLVAIQESLSDTKHLVSRSVHQMLFAPWNYHRWNNPVNWECRSPRPWQYSLEDAVLLRYVFRVI